MRSLKNQGREIGRKPEPGQLKGEPDHSRVIVCLESPLRLRLHCPASELCWHNILKELLITSELLSHRREHVWSWLLGDGNDYVPLTSRWKFGKEDPHSPL